MTENEKLPTQIYTACATGAGYLNHWRRNEIPCANCKNGQRLKSAKYRREHPEKKKAEGVAYRLANKDKILASRLRRRVSIAAKNKRWRDANPQWLKDWRLAHPERTKEIQRKSYAKHREKRLAEKIIYLQTADPEIFRNNRRKRRARELNIGSEPYTANLILKIYGTDCYICHKPIDLMASRTPGKNGWEFGLHLEHVIPLSRGGSDLIENIRPSHGICNLKKSTSILEEAV